MTFFEWITLLAVLMAVVIANTDECTKLQFWMAVMLYMTLVAVVVSWWLGVRI